MQSAPEWRRQVALAREPGGESDLARSHVTMPQVGHMTRDDGFEHAATRARAQPLQPLFPLHARALGRAERWPRPRTATRQSNQAYACQCFHFRASWGIYDI